MVQVEQALQSARKHVADRICPWAVMSVWGYASHPMPWMDSPPASGAQSERENNYCVVVLPNDQYIMFVASGSGDSFQTV